MHKIKSFSILEILTIQLSILSPAKTSDSVFADETNALLIHIYLNLLPLSGILHSNILAIFLLYYSRRTLYAWREQTLELRSNRDASRLVGSQMTCSVFFGIQTQRHETSRNRDDLHFPKIQLAVLLCVWLILALMIRPWFTIQLH